MYKNILVPLDGSGVAEQAFKHALDLAKTVKAKIVLFCVIEVYGLLEEERDLEYAMLKSKVEQYLEMIIRMVQDEGVSVETVIKQGSPDVEICDYADWGGVDLIVMTTKGLGGLKRVALGSVAERVITGASKPVLVVRATPKELLDGKKILAVDDEPDVLDIIEEQLDMCEVQKATDYESAEEYLDKNTYDFAILDIMGVNGFELLKKTVHKGIPTIMLTAHALTEEALKKSMKAGAVFYLPKDKLPEIEEILVSVIQHRTKSIWEKFLSRFAPYFRRRFGWSYKDEEEFIKEVQSILRRK